MIFILNDFLFEGNKETGRFNLEFCWKKVRMKKSGFLNPNKERVTTDGTDICVIRGSGGCIRN